MNLGERFDGFCVKFFDYFIKDGVARLIAIDINEKIEFAIMLKDG